MGLFKKKPKKEQTIAEISSDTRPIAYPLRYSGPGPYQIPFKGSGFGVVFEDDGETGYFYGTTEKMDNIFDALLLYNAGTAEQLTSNEEIFVVWSLGLKKAGIFYRDKFQAVFDFKNQHGRCRSGFPPSNEWCRSSHDWDDSIINGLEP